MFKKIIVHNPNNLKTIDYHKLTILQGDLKTLSKENRTKLCNSIKQHGYFVPAFIWESDNNLYILDATQRYHALEQLEKEGYEIPEIPYIKIEAKNKKDAAEKLLQITSRYGEINPETTFFEDFNIDLEFINDIEIPELDIKLEDLAPEIVEDEVPEPPIEPLSKTGDLWLLGKHRILCGDATKEEDVKRLLKDRDKYAMLTDPPYNVGFHYESINDKKDENAYKLFCQSWFELFHPYSLIFTPGPRNEKYYPSPLDKGVWVKRNATAGATIFHLRLAEPVLFYGIFNHKRNTDVFEYSSGFTQELKEARLKAGVSESHAPAKSMPFWVELISMFDNDLIVVDGFLGNGTTLIASEQLNRICYGMEISEQYIDVILERFYKLTGDDPIREDGVKWSELKSSLREQTD